MSLYSSSTGYKSPVVSFEAKGAKHLRRHATRVPASTTLLLQESLCIGNTTSQSSRAPSEQDLHSRRPAPVRVVTPGMKHSNLVTQNDVAQQNRPCEFLQSVKDGHLQQFFGHLQQFLHVPKNMTSAQKLIAVADALDVRTRLMVTEVPLSSVPRTAYGFDFEITTTSQCILPEQFASSGKCRKPSMPDLSPIHDKRVPPLQHLCPIATEALQLDGNLKCSTSVHPVTPMISQYATVKISNIPWDASTEQVMEFLGKNIKLAQYTSTCTPVHFVLDRTSGKTQSDVFLEIVTVADAERFAQRKTGRSIGSRSVTVELVSSKEMLTSIFPRNRDGQWLTREEIQNVLTHAKTFKSPYTRKCPQRPFENFISILALFPWASNTVHQRSQVELLYSGYVSIVSILRWHIRKGKISALNTRLMERLIIAGTNLTCFTMCQKQDVCVSVGIYPGGCVPLDRAICHGSEGQEFITPVSKPDFPLMIKPGNIMWQTADLRMDNKKSLTSQTSITLDITSSILHPTPLKCQVKDEDEPAIPRTVQHIILNSLDSSYKSEGLDDKCRSKIHRRKDPMSFVPSSILTGDCKDELLQSITAREKDRENSRPVGGKLTMKEQWLLNASRAGIAVTPSVREIVEWSR